jgi:DNA polymerase III subunit epsilon
MNHYPANEEVVILDFETTGLSSSEDRIIEVGAAIVGQYEIRSTFQSLCDPGTSIPSFISSLTGITNTMVKNQPPPETVMNEFYKYIGNRPIIAHNASFDSRFLRSEMARVDKSIDNPILCTMLLARRLLPECFNHKLGTLKEHINYQSEADHQDHRALDDVKVTASLWNFLQHHVEKTVGHNELHFSEFQRLSKISKYKVLTALKELSKKSIIEV